jgi:beta-galactosidase
LQTTGTMCLLLLQLLLMKKELDVQITDNQIKFTITDSGRIIAVDNGNIINHDGYQGATTRAYQGKAIIIIKATKDSDTITLKADGEGLDQV